MSSSPQDLLKFAALQSFVLDTFWHKLAEVKLDHDRLSDAPKPIYGFYTNRMAKSCLLEVDYSAFNSAFKPPKYCYAAPGTLYNMNTVEDFKECDKTALLQKEGLKIVDDMKSGRVLDDPSLLSRFLVLSFGDLKCHTYYYWFAFPCLLTTTLAILDDTRKLQDAPELLNLVQANIGKILVEEQNFCVWHSRPDGSGEFSTLKEALSNPELDTHSDDFSFCFADASEFEHPAWHMRSYAVFVFYKCPFLVGRSVKFMGLRCDNQMQLGGSRIWLVKQADHINLDAEEGSAPLKFVGWEPNKNNKMTPRLVCMEDSMDPAKLAENSVHLNLKLMKWRLVPDLDLDAIMGTKCILFGAGTLGCAVARSLLGWGFKHITFLDSGKVGFANPVRQCLYRHSDAVGGRNKKATTAAERVKEINPNTISTGHVLQIPMPGYTVGESMRQQTEENLNKITNLIQEHDAIFLLTDSRESRWLPTLLGAHFNKIVINAALGFDSYLVMRHGARPRPTDADDVSPEFQHIDGLKCISGAELGCYFCNDVTAPGNSTKDRTLDQQCTVTRPGVSNIAASYAVELLVSLLIHPNRSLAPAYYATGGESSPKIPEGLLGIIPHSIRGMLFNYENILPATERFTQCIACSSKILSAYAADGNAFLFKAFETAKFLEDLTGISAFKDLDNELIDYEDSDLEISD